MKKFLVILMVVAMAAFLFVGCIVQPPTYTLTMAVNPTGGGTTTPAVGAHPAQTDGTVVNISATPASGYKFVNWTGDVADLNSASTTVTMDADKTVTANFELIPVPEVTYDLTMQVSPTGSGTTTPAVGTHNYASGAVVNISATPASGYKFVDWTGDVADSNSASTTVTMNADKTVKANFEELPTNAPIITSVPEAADGYVNAAEAAGGIVVNGIGRTFAEIFLYINGVLAGSGDVGVTAEWTVVIAEDDLGVDGDKILYATAKEETRYAESPPSNEIEFTLDTVAPKIEEVKARAGRMATFDVDLTYQTIPFIFTAALFAPNQLLLGEVDWMIEIMSFTGTPDLVTVRVYNLTAGTDKDYFFPNLADSPITSSTSWIPGARVTVDDPLWTATGLDSTLHVGAYALITTINTGEILGRVSLEYNEDVSFTQAWNGAYTIYNNFFGWDILTWLIPPQVVIRMAYDESTDTMYWTEQVGAGWLNLAGGEWLTFQVSDVADIAGNTIPLVETDNTVVLPATADIGP